MTTEPPVAMGGTTLASPAVARRRLGTALRELRTGADISIERAAQVLECSVSKISRLETGLGVPRSRDVRDLIELIGGAAVERREELLGLAVAGQAPPWYQRYNDLLSPELRRFFDLESGASEEWVFGGAWVPGLLQTPGYATAVLSAFNPERSAAEIERLVALRMGRKRVMDSDLDAPLKLTAIVDESVLLRSVGGPTVMREQLAVLREAVVDPFDNVEVYLLPFSAGMTPILAGDLTVLRFTDAPDVVWSEGHTGQAAADRSDSIAQAAGMFDAALAATMDGARLVDRLSGLIDDLHRADPTAPIADREVIGGRAV